MNKKIIPLIAMCLLMAVLLSGPAQSAPEPVPDASHSVVTNEFGCWYNPAEDSEGHFDEENGDWIILTV